MERLDMMRLKRNRLVDTWSEQTEAVRIKLLVEIMDLEEEINEMASVQKKSPKASKLKYCY